MTSKQASTVSHSLASRQAAQILYRMANSASSSAAGTSAGTLITEPITPITPLLVHAGPTMLQPAPAHFAVTTSGFNQAGGSGHNFIPVYFQNAGGGGGAAQKQDGGSMTFQFQPQQYQVLQQQPQQQQQGRTVYQLNIAGDSLNQQYQVARMANGAMVAAAPPTGGKGRAGGRKPASKDDKVSKLSSEEQDRRKVRRERNKQAAARCRKRRMDQTNILTEETEGLEEVQNQLKSEIEKYQQDINEIQYILEAHRSACSKDIPVTAVQASLPTGPPRARSVGMSVPVSITSTQPDTVIMPPPPVISISQVPSSVSVQPDPVIVEPNTTKKRANGAGGVARPASLPVKPDLQLDLLAMPTPSPSKLVFNFESHSGLTPTGLTPTGLTPLIPSCSADGQEKSDQTGASDGAVQGTSPNNLVSL